MEEAMEKVLQPMPEHKCADCGKTFNGKCLCFNRPIDVDYNKCFLHSFYNPVVIKFEPPPNLEEIMAEEEREQENRMKGKRCH